MSVKAVFLGVVLSLSFDLSAPLALNAQTPPSTPAASTSPATPPAPAASTSPATPPAPAASTSPATPPVPAVSRSSSTKAASGSSPATKAKTVGPVAEQAPPPVVKPLPPCYDYSATPLDSRLLEIDKKLYFTTPKLPSDPTAATAYLIEADLESRKVKRVAGFKAGQSVSLVPHGKHAYGISIFDFSQGKPDCGEGLSSGTELRPSEQKVLPSFPNAYYGLIADDTGMHLADLQKGLISEIDILTNQKRTLQRFPRGSRPLYLRTSPPTVLYSYSPDTLELGRFIANKKVARDTLKLKPSSRLIRDGDKFALVLAQGQNLQVNYVKGWSGDDEKTIDLVLPAGFQGSEVAINARFASEDLLVFGKNEMARRSLRSVLRFTGKNLQVYKAPNAQSYFSFASFLKDGTIILLVSELDSGVISEIWTIVGGAEPSRWDVLKSQKPAAEPMK
jgi:hypothetical protein